MPTCTEAPVICFNKSISIQSESVITYVVLFNRNEGNDKDDKTIFETKLTLEENEHEKGFKHKRTVNFIPRHLIHVNHPLLPVHLHNLPFFPLNDPRTILTSSSFLTGIDRQLCCFFSSGDSEADMILRRSLDGAVKCALRDLRRDEDTFGLNFIAVVR